MRSTLPVLLLAVLVATPQAQSRAQAVPPVAEQITAAVLPLPEAMRAGAGVMGYRTVGKLEVLRAPSNGMICLADDPRQEGFHVACYAESLEPFMARGRALRASGVVGPQVDSVRFAEVRNGTIKMPAAGALYQLTGPAGDFDPATGKARTARGLFVLYMPNATVESTGLSDKPSAGPWLMFPGTPKAHLMLTIGM
jgi:hypothetical protein